MRAIQVTRPGGPEVLEVVDLPEPEPQAGEVTVRTTMVGVNFADLFQRMMPGEQPMVPGIEAVGIVESVGEGVAGLRQGQRVIAAPFYRHGAYAEKVLVEATHAIPIPDGISDEAAATLTLNYGTAWAALHHCGRVRPGDTILIHAAAGGVGIAAIQLAKLVEGTYLIGTASAAKHDYLRAQGVHETIDYRTQDWVAEVRRAHPDGVDIVLDSVAEAGYLRSIGMLRHGGLVVGFGQSSILTDAHSEPDVEGAMSQSLSLNPLLNEAVGFIGCHLGVPAPLFRKWMGHIIGLCEQDAIEPHIDRVFALGEAADAHRYLHERRNIGKVLLRP